jgi:prepilin-type N-terminal cleavage/methylation domain-containing protein
MLERMRRAKREEAGFTLIELLIVIVILGILAAIVVFAVNGIQDRGTASACKADVETVTVAAEAFDAQNGYYAGSMDDLVSAGFLHSVPGTSNYVVDYKLVGPKRARSVSVSSSSCPGATSSADDVAAYCAELQSASERFQGLRFQALDVDQFQKAVAIFEEVAASAPSAVTGDWSTLVDVLKQMQRIVARTGLSHDELVMLSNGEIPEGYSQEQLDDLNQALQVPTSGDDFRTAAENIGRHAQQNCSGIGG